MENRKMWNATFHLKNKTRRLVLQSEGYPSNHAGPCDK